MTGNDGNNILNGGAGIDTLIGGAGDDTYIVDSTTDTITELANGGTDIVQSSVSYTLANTTVTGLANVENLTLTGNIAINGTGNGLDNRIIGNGRNNTLNGGDGTDTLIGGLGNDILTGGLGKDTLTGGAGVDRFDYRTLADSVFNTFDVITDFNATAGDLFVVSTVPTTFSNLGTVQSLDETGIGNLLTTSNFGAGTAGQFSFGSRTFVAINDGTAEFAVGTDAIIEVTGLTGTLTAANFTNSLV
ncbi:calcium-binding protein [Cuspidothrix issatschenkoi LEGE 03284]|nr:calcium-binding protein [Cuspidothrix issatschenkoi LEGE 03284]